MWVTEHERDIESDLSVFHRVDDPMALDGPTYFERAQRLAAYAGVMQARVLQEQEERERPATPAPAPGRTAPTSSAHSGTTRVSDDVALAMLAADDWAPERVTEGSPA